MSRRLVARLDNIGDVLLAGPAVRAVASSGGPVTFLAGPSGADAAVLLPGVESLIVFDAPWVPYVPSPVDGQAMATLIDDVRRRAIDEAIVLTSFHQSPLPLAMLLRLAGVRRIAATCVDYPGALLDIRHPYEADLHEVEQALALCAAAGHRLPRGDHGLLALDMPPARRRLADVDGEAFREYVVVHPGASVPARALPAPTATEVVTALTATGYHVVVTGSASEHELGQAITSGAPPGATSVRCGSTGLAELAAVIADACAVVCGNTSVAHIAAAVGTPVVEAFAPVVPAHRWRPWGVPHVLLGSLDIGCSGCRARKCPVPGQPCLQPFTATAVIEAVEFLTDPTTRWASSRRVSA